MSSSNQTAGAATAPAIPAFAREIAQAVIAEIQRRGVITPEYLDTAQASLYTGMSQDWFAKARCEGTGPKFSKVSDARGGAVRYRRSDLDAFMSARATGGRA